MFILFCAVVDLSCHSHKLLDSKFNHCGTYKRLVRFVHLVDSSMSLCRTYITVVYKLIIQSTFFGQYKDSSYHEALVAVASTDIFTSPRAIVSFELYGITRGRSLKNAVLTFRNNTLALIVNLEFKENFSIVFL